MQPTPDPITPEATFQKLLAQPWREAFSDAGAGDWREKWFLGGATASVANSANGFEIKAGPAEHSDTSHCVLWTKASFAGDLRIEYDYTRTDQTPKGVNLIYIQATGSGAPGQPKDIFQSTESRAVAKMSAYFNHMHLYHISYAVEPPKRDGNDYVRARRYMPETGKGLAGTDIEPNSYRRTGLFRAGVRHRITIVKRDWDLFMRVTNADQQACNHLTNHRLPPITGGRVALRLMAGRSARFTDFRVSVSE